jgi:hypothetical protein
VKKSARYQTAGGYDVVTGIQEAVIDPAATLKAVKPLVEALPETAQAKAVGLKILAQQKIMLEENAKAAAKKEADPDADISAEEARWKLAKANIEAEEQNLKPLFEAIEAARGRLFEEAAVYFPPQPGEKHLSPAEEADLTAKRAALGEHEALTLTGEVIPDNRGREYWEKSGGVWTKTKIEEIGAGIPDGAILPESLNDAARAEIAEQAEAERIAELTPEQKAAEKQARLDAAADEAVRLERRAEIQGKDFDGAAYYAEKETEIEEKYA